ncbi:MAG: 50S ribosomal protein L6 [Acidobacteriota bacterium]|nr:50S ribosomal protein L6 [Acidobacteriota bacterium]MDP9113281.1 50S ribosomal protein L6 [Acidobacteriota bacterium]
MSRVGKKLIPMPKGVKVTVGDQLTVEGPKGKQTVPVPKGITFSEKDGVLTVIRDGDDKAALHGLTRALTANAIQGVSTGFTRELAIFGIGYRCEVKGRIATFTLGYSHSIEFYLPDGVDLKVDKPANNLTPLLLTGSDKQIVGQVAAKMRALRPPDPYKNKGIRYVGELLRKKVGKTGASGGK